MYTVHLNMTIVTYYKTNAYKHVHVCTIMYIVNNYFSLSYRMPRLKKNKLFFEER